ncbi:hypothetical protein ACFJIV_12655 [Mucilaginibacter sp. UC70_90]
MSSVEEEVKVRRIVVDPRISLTMVGRLVVATDRGKLGIIKKCKYPSEFVPGYHELARKLICETFAGNFKGDSDLYFDEFKRKAKEYRAAALGYPKEKVGYKNNFFSAEALDGVVAMEGLLTLLLDEYTCYSNLGQKKSLITLNTVRVGAMADILLKDQYGLDEVGFIKFNFSRTRYPAEEAAVKLKVLKSFYDEKNAELNPNDCILVDVPTRRIYTLDEVPDAGKALKQATILIRDNWDLI